jgi:hypothetical protein
MPEQGGLARERCPTNIAPQDLDMGCVRMLFLLVHSLFIAAREFGRAMRALIRLSPEMGVDVAVEVGFAGECPATALDRTDVHLDWTIHRRMNCSGKLAPL